MSLEDDYEKILVKKKKIWQKLNQELQNSPEVYNWQIQVDAGGSGKVGRYFLNGIAIAVILIGLLAGWLTIRGDNWVFFWISNGVCLFMALFIRFLWFADNLYDYHLTEKGIYYTRQQAIPDMAYSVVRGSAWVGVAVCVAAAALVGPIAFIGAGAFALMSFGMMKFNPIVNNYWIYFQGTYEFAHIKDEGIIKLASDIREPYYSKTIYCHPENKSHLIALLQSILPDTQVSEVSHFRDFRDFIHSSRN